MRRVYPSRRSLRRSASEEEEGGWNGEGGEGGDQKEGIVVCHRHGLGLHQMIERCDPRTMRGGWAEAFGSEMGC